MISNFAEVALFFDKLFKAAFYRRREYHVGKTAMRVRNLKQICQITTRLADVNRLSSCGADRALHFGNINHCSKLFGKLPMPHFSFMSGYLHGHGEKMHIIAINVGL